MNKLEKLIQELCPEGVPNIPLGSFARCVAGATPSSTISEYWENGTIPWMSSGEVNKGTVFETDKLITERAFESCSTKMLPPETVVMALAGQGKTRGMVARTKIALCTNQSLCGIIPDPSVNSDFLYHFLKSRYRALREMSSGDGGRGGLNLEIVRSVNVPVPPMRVQMGIVSILDSFTKLEAELEAELEARNLQIESVRSGIVHRRVSSDYELGKFELGDLVELVNERKTFANETDSLYVGVEDLLKDKRGFQPSVKIVPEGSHLSFLPGDTLIGNIRPYLRKAWFAGQDGLTNGDVLVFRVKPEAESLLLPAYLREILLSEEFFEFMIARSKGAKMPRGDKAAALTFEVSLPPIEQQLVLSNRLSVLSSLVSSSIVGLPAEIQARRKQYEYYRTKLLTFKELVAV